MAIATLTAGAVLSAHIVLDDPSLPDQVRDGTLALAPISLGNPAAAAVNLSVTSPRPGAYGTTTAQEAFKPYEQSLRVGRGDTLSGMLTDAGVPPTEAHDAIAALKGHFNARRLRAGDTITATFQPHADNMQPGYFLGLEIPEDVRRSVVVSRTLDGRFQAKAEEKVLTPILAGTAGTISSSLYAAGDKAGMPVPILVEMIRLFSWDVDFQRDIREGDGFEVMFEHLTDEHGTVVDTGKILFASLTLRGDRNVLYRHTLSDGTVDYFNEKGHGARKALLRTPIDGARLSSRFGKRRHPVLGYTKRHSGVDFAAPRGTPIYAAGDGTISFIGRKGPNGNLIRIRHNGSYRTAYAHMKGFAKGMYKGRRVRQGQIIGYVGTTGRSTGPHLHYEIAKDGRRVNPLTVKMPSGRKLQGHELAQFKETRDGLRRHYAALALPAQVAQNTAR